MKICFYRNDTFDEIVEVTGDIVVTQNSVESDSYKVIGVNCPFLVCENEPNIEMYTTFIKKIALSQLGVMYQRNIDALNQDVTITSLEELESRKSTITTQYFQDRNVLINCNVLDDIKILSESYAEIKVNNITV